MENQPIDTLAIVSMLISLAGLIVAIIVYYAAVKERHAKSAAEATGLKMEVISLKEDVDELKNEWREAQEGYHSNAKKIARIEEQLKTLFTRVETLERKVENV